MTQSQPNRDPYESLLGPITYDPKARAATRFKAVLSLMRLRAAEGHLPVFRQMCEMMWLWIRNGVRPPYYLSAALYRRELTWSEKRAHISVDKYYEIADRINDLRYRFLTDNKIATQGVLEMFEIPTPRFFGYVHERNGRTFDGKPLCGAADVGELLRRIDVDEVAFKLLAGFRGKGFFKASLDAERETVTIDPGGRRLSIQSLWDEVLNTDRHMGYFCQDVVDQHPDASRFNPASLNTIRTWLYQTRDGQWEVYNAVFRIGVGDMITDNLSLGGIGPRIELSTGVMKAAISRRPERPLFRTHPTTGVAIEGERVPMWEESVELGKRAAQLFPFLQFLAVDVALSREGPVVTEIEGRPDDHQVGFDEGLGVFLKKLQTDR